MLELFRKNLFVYNGFLLLYCLLLRLVGFLKPYPIVEETNLLADYLSNWVGGVDSWTASLVAFFLLLFNAIQINRLVSMNRLTPTSSLFPGVFYILICSMTIDFQGLSDAILGNTFLIMMLLEVFKQTRNEKLLIRTFNVGLWAGLAALAYSPYVILLPLGIVSMIIVRTFKRADYLRTFIGFMCPFIIMATILFMLDRIGDLWHVHFEDTFAWLDGVRAFGWQDYVVTSLYVLASIIAFLSMNSLTMKTNIHSRRKYSTLYIYLAILAILVPIVAQTGVLRLEMLSVPLSIFVGALFLRLEKQAAEVMHFLLLALAFSMHYVF